MDAYELALLTGEDIDEIRAWPMEKLNEWRAFFLVRAETKKDG